MAAKKGGLEGVVAASSAITRVDGERGRLFYRGIDVNLGTAANFLHMLSGQMAPERMGRILDQVLIIHADHELNASTFTARVTASTLADIYAAASAAMGALSGPLHGGANEDVWAMLEEIGDPARTDEHITGMLRAGRKIPGFGHRVYKHTDPRGESLRPILKELAEATGETKWYDMWKEIERVMERERPGLHANLDSFSALVYHWLGIPTDLFTPVFACSRIVGWTAHVLEQYEHNRLIRPIAEYAGPTDVQYVPIEQREARAA